jgi:hypothetical protein
MMTTVGYARVSSLGQDLAVQLQELKGCDRVFNEKRSGVDRTSLAMIGFGESYRGPRTGAPNATPNSLARRARRALLPGSQCDNLPGAV